MSEQYPITTTILAAVFIPLALFILLHHNRYRKNSKQQRYPPVLPLGWIATTRHITSNEAPWFLLEWARKIGSVYRVRIPYFGPIFVVGDPIVAREIMNDPLTTKPHSFYGAIDVPLGATCFFSANGERWKHARKATALAFSSSHIKRMNQICQEKLDDWIERRLNVFCESGQAFDPAAEMIRLSLAIICEAAFEYEMKEEEAELFLKELNFAMTEFVLKQGDNPIRATWLGYLFGYNEIRRAQKAGRHLRAVMENILHTFRSKQETETAAATSKGTVIDCIVRNQHYLNDKERIADLLIFLVGGHDASAYSIAWTLLELARHPNILQNLRNQLTSLGSEEERLKCTALDHLIKESMRLHTVAAIAGVRETQRDFQVKDMTATSTSATIIIPKGAIAIIAPLLVHRNPQYFDQPDEFLPERWNSIAASGTVAVAAATTACMPFLVGPRNCVGMALATAELHTVIARLVMEYNFEVIDAGRSDYTLNLKPFGVLLKAYKN